MNDLDKALKEMLLEALSHANYPATPEETLHMFSTSDSYKRHKQAILAILAQEVKIER